MVRYFGPDNGSAYVILPNGRPAVGRIASVYADDEGTILADILAGDRETQGEPLTYAVVDSTGRLNFWFPDEQPVVWVRVNDGPLVRVTADLQDQLDDAIISGGGGGGGVTIGQVNAAIGVHNADSTAVHGIADTSALETAAGAQSKADVAAGTAISTAASDATTKAATAQANAISTAAADATSKVAAHVAAVDPHGDRSYADGQLATKADLVGGFVPTSQIPAIAITDFLGTVANQAAMLALSGQKGDWAIRSDTGTTWVISGNTPSNLSSWTQMPSAGAPVVSVNGLTGAVTLAKADIGLDQVDNTSDAAKPVSTATQTALNLKANLASPTFTGTVGGITKAMVGLGSADNTADTAKPVSVAQQAALDLKAPLASPTFTGTVNGITKTMVGLANADNTADIDKPISTLTAAALAGKQDGDADLTAIAALAPTNNDIIQRKAGAWTNRTIAQLVTDLALTKSSVGLGNVDNTSDVAKPVSTLQQAALDLKAPLASPTFTGTVAGITKTMVGLGNVDNTADASKTFAESQITGLVADLAAKQPLDADLTTIAGLTATTDNILQAVAGAWASRTPAQVKTALAIAQSDVSGLTIALAAKADLVGGLVPTSQLPALAITEVFTAANQTAMLALTAQRGDVALRTDVGKTYILSTDSPTTLADWKEISAIGVVQSVNGQVGVVVLAKGDVGLGSVDNTSDAGKPVSTAQQTALNLKADLASPTFTGTPTLPTGTIAVTQTAGNNTTAVATTAFVAALGALKANLASPTFTGTVSGVTAAMVGAPALSVLTTKGDVFVATASGAVARQAAGANGTILQTDSAQTNGVKYVNNNQTQTWSYTGTAVAATVGKTRWYNRTGRTLTVVGTWVAANTAPTGAAIVVDVNKNGTSFYGTATKPQVAVSTNGGVLAAPDTGTTLADGDYVTVDVDSVGSTVAGADVTIGVVYW